MTNGMGLIYFLIRNYFGTCLAEFLTKCMHHTLSPIHALIVLICVYSFADGVLSYKDIGT